MISAIFEVINLQKFEKKENRDRNGFLTEKGRKKKFIADQLIKIMFYCNRWRTCGTHTHTHRMTNVYECELFVFVLASFEWFYLFVSSMLHRVQYNHTHAQCGWHESRMYWFVCLFVFLCVCVFIFGWIVRNRCGGWRIDDRHAEMMMYVKEISVDGRIKNDVKCKSEWQRRGRRR